MRKREIFVHAHIPKCGGSTFQAILKRNFGDGFRRDSGLLEDYQYNANQFRKIIYAHPWLRCYSSHKISLDLPYHLEDVSVRAIVFVRHPVDRFISHYFYHRNNTAANYSPLTKTLALSDYIQHALEQGHQRMYIDGQTRFLTGQPNKGGLAKIENLIEEKNILLLPLDRFDECCLILEKLYPSQFKNCAYVKHNTSIKNQTITPKDRQRIVPYVNYDLELVEMAHTFLDYLLNSHFPKENERMSALSDFRKRCEKQRRLGKVFQTIIRPSIALARKFLSRSGFS